ncbi:MAG: ParA family protein [Spirochaetia bacterium]|jgi:chromosome partitioning protein|nr:ParA family protein [Spirochaetia bacterium]MCF7940275.1 ParA family protein [Spirochaetia bacterium]
MVAKKIVFANQKGGVGKTTTSVNLGAYLADAGKKVLLIDFDPQGNMTSAVGADDELDGIYEVISGDVSLFEAVQKTPVDNLFIVGSNINLAGANVELSHVQGNEYYLKKQLDQVVHEWDYIIIDCPPSLGILTLNGLVAADFVIVPLQCEYFALEGLSMLMKTIKNIQKNLNRDLSLLGIVFTMYDARTRLANDVVSEVVGYFKEKVFSSYIPRNIRLSEAPSHGLPINLYDPRCAGAVSYKKLAKEVVERV